MQSTDGILGDLGSFWWPAGMTMGSYFIADVQMFGSLNLSLVILEPSQRWVYWAGSLHLHGSTAVVQEEQRAVRVFRSALVRLGQSSQGRHPCGLGV